MFLSLSSFFFKQINNFLGLSQPPWVLDCSLCLVHTAQFLEAKFSTSSNIITLLQTVAFHLLCITLLGSACFYSLAPCRLDATGDPVMWHGISLSNTWEQICLGAKVSGCSSCTSAGGNKLSSLESSLHLIGATKQNTRADDSRPFPSPSAGAETTAGLCLLPVELRHCGAAALFAQLCFGSTCWRDLAGRRM